MKPITVGPDQLDLFGATVGEQRRAKSQPVRIISDYGTFIKECYDWWRDGCQCVACKVVNSYEAGQSSDVYFQSRMQVLSDFVNHQHGDGVYLDVVYWKATRGSANSALRRR